MRANMKAERARNGLRAEDVAHKIGVSTGTLFAWENGKKEPKSSNLMRLASLYGCAPEYLLGVTDEHTGRAIARCKDERT